MLDKLPVIDQPFVPGSVGDAFTAHRRSFFEHAGGALPEQITAHLARHRRHRQGEARGRPVRFVRLVVI